MTDFEEAGWLSETRIQKNKLSVSLVAIIMAFIGIENLKKVNFYSWFVNSAIIRACARLTLAVDIFATTLKIKNPHGKVEEISFVSNIL